MEHLLAFCRIALSLLFAVSTARKIVDFAAFARAVRGFALVPASLARPAAVLVLAAEVAVAVLLCTGGPLLRIGFVLAGLLLLTFCLALSSALRRRIVTSCNCFGASDRPVSRHAIYRNVLFLCCAVGGGWASAAANGPATLSAPEWGLTGLMAVVFSAVSIQLEELVQIFR
jgi:hypothetical protein